ncbi:MAG TPA: 3-oxoacyl-ACP reductase [Ktedonobacter sp.]|jgi:3-oxoacyl-[acyl-carrier protein] reductase|nr:3-oxoacyl-ACP reductase [Ktedonobacter sp.]HAT46207.1 3-oxoacyl-ACP reductase [Ktedonobacter sp.]HBE25512.1 3-oxoacyl-ACP reductase [Ktedonobacter sp.]HCF86522.1 3-oxoacyl-ACP reductase [Ktedonobacter sp.]HCJ35170.1 3-oxoacyl-ACP reductase [Ktedonobacter sp.]
MGMLDGKVAILTGAGRGIGSAAAKMFAAEGAMVVVSDLDPNPAEETASAIKNAGGKAVVVAGDVTDPAFPAQLIKATLDAYSGIDIIVNNAGYTWDGVIQNMTDKQWYAMIDVHTTAPFRILREASHFIRDAAKKEQAAHGRANPRKVVNVSSVSGVYGNAGQVNYSTAKAGITGLTKTLAKEWGRYNVQVNCVCYGFIETRLTAPKEHAEKVQRDGEEIALGVPDQARQMAPLLIPLGRPGTPEEAAGPMLFLASPLSNYVSGHVLEITGGRAI